MTENKASPYRKQRVVGRLGDGGVTTIDVELLQSDGKTPYSIFSNQNLIFVGTNSKGEYTDGVPEIVDGQKGIIRYTFTKGNFSVLKEFKRAYFQLTDADGSRVTFQDFTVDVLKNSDIDQGQVTLYVRLLDQLLSDFEKRFGDQSINFEERFKVFLQAKESQYQNIYQMYNDLVLKLDNLTKDTKTIQEMQAEILKSIEEHDVFTKQESSTNVVYQVIGKENAKINITLDYQDKIAGSVVENPHKAVAGFSSVLPVPAQITGEVSQNAYNALSALDGNVTSPYTATNKDMTYFLFKWNVLETIKQKLGEKFFLNQGAATTSECMSVIRSLIKEFRYNVYGFGSGPSGNRLETTIWNGTGNNWSTGIYRNTSSGISKITRTMSSLAEINGFFTEDGFVYVIAYAEASNGTTASKINVDYADLEITIDLSANEHIKSMMAQYSGENIATQEEAEVGEDNTKTMTSLRVFQSIAQWTKNKFISLTENETVLGIKNFENGLQVGGRNVLSQEGEKRFVTNSTNNSSIESGSIVFKRFGDDVEVYVNFQVRASGDLTRDMNIVAESVVDDIFEPGENFSFFIGNESAQAVVKFVGKAIKAHSTLTKSVWYVGTTSYKAKNKL